MESTKDTRALLKWLRTKHKASERLAKQLGRAGSYGEAAIALGRCEAYAWTVVHIEAEMKRHKRAQKAAG